MNPQTPEVQPEPPQSPLKTALQLPEPDRENITVLLHNLPKDPVLPWNRYDSPWESEEESSAGEGAEPGTSDPPEDDRPENTPPETALQNSDTQDSSDLALEETAMEIIESVPEEAIPEEAIEGDSDPVKTFEPGFVNLSPQTVEETVIEVVDYPHQAASQEALEETGAESQASEEPDEDHGLLSQLG